MTSWKDNDKVLTMKGTIHNHLPYYKDTFNLPVTLTTRTHGLRPTIQIVQPSSSDLAIEQDKGINCARLVFLIENLLFN